jgi:hypothetical protein
LLNACPCHTWHPCCCWLPCCFCLPSAAGSPAVTGFPVIGGLPGASPNSALFQTCLSLVACIPIVAGIPPFAGIPAVAESVLRRHPFCSKIFIQLLAFQLFAGVPAIVSIPAVASFPVAVVLLLLVSWSLINLVTLRTRPVPHQLSNCDGCNLNSQPRLQVNRCPSPV